MNRRNLLPALFVLSAVLVAPLATAQVVMRHGGDGENDVVFLKELGVIAAAAQGSDAVEVIMLIPGTEREVALQKGDLVLMVNGQRIRELATLREAYEGTAVGDVVKLGFRRADERFLSSFEKADADAEAEGGTRIMIAGGPGGDFDDMQPLQEFGVLLAEKDGEVTVSMELPMGEAALQKGDLVHSINGESITSLAGFREVYESVEVGQEVALIVERDGEKIDVARSRSSSEGIRVRRAH